MSRTRTEIPAKSTEQLVLGQCQFDRTNGLLHDTLGVPIELRNQSVQVLQFLADHNGIPVTKDALIAAVWGDRFVTDDSLVQCISEIRRALGDTKQNLIQTLPRRGYQLNGELSVDEAISPKFAHRRSIYVQAFKCIGGDDDRAFAEGLSEDLVTRLSMVRNFEIFAERSDYAFKREAGPPQDLENTAAENVLVGSVRLAENKVRVTAQLLNRATGTAIFSRRYDEEIDDIFKIQDDITSQIITETQVALTEGEAARLSHRQTRSVKAWEYFHQGVLEHFKYTEIGNSAARQLYEQSLKHDPNYLDARVAEAWTHWFDYRSSFVSEPENSLEICRARVNEIVSEAPDFADIMQLDAALLVLEGHHEAASKRAEEAYEAGPSLLYSRAITAWVNLYAGNLERAKEIYEENINASPYIADDLLFYYAQCLSLLGEHAEAVALAKDYRKRVEGTVYGYTLLATAQGLAGQYVAAAETVAELRKAHPRFTIETFRQHEPFKDVSIVNKLTRELRRAGLE